MRSIQYLFTVSKTKNGSIHYLSPNTYMYRLYYSSKDPKTNAVDYYVLEMFWCIFTDNLFKMNLETSFVDDMDDIHINLYTDPRVLWFKERILSYIGMDDDELFYNMLEGDNKSKFVHFITATMKHHDLSLDKKTFYVAKIIVDKLIHEDKEFTEWRKYTVIC